MYSSLAFDVCLISNSTLCVISEAIIRACVREISDTWARILFLQSSRFMAPGLFGVFIVVAGKSNTDSFPESTTSYDVIFAV